MSKRLYVLLSCSSPRLGRPLCLAPAPSPLDAAKGPCRGWSVALLLHLDLVKEPCYGLHGIVSRQHLYVCNGRLQTLGKPPFLPPDSGRLHRLFASRKSVRRDPGVLLGSAPRTRGRQGQRRRHQGRPQHSRGRLSHLVRCNRRLS